ncbi:MAG: LLM class flavin-dependent oxidoreductase [Chthonomonadales bacterium]
MGFEELMGSDRLLIGITEHVEGPAETPSADLYAEIERQVVLADRSGIDFYWFSEHHRNAHFGHLPSPLLYAVHLLARTKNIQLGTAIICLNLHNPVAVSQEILVADALSNGRLAAGFGSGSTPEEFQLFKREVTSDLDRHRVYEEALKEIRAQITHEMTLPRPNVDLWSRCWSAVNSDASACIGGRMGLNMLFSHLRTPEQNRQYSTLYRENGGSGHIALNRPIFLAESSVVAWREAEPVLRLLFRRFQSEGKIGADVEEPDNPVDLCQHPINFIVGTPTEAVDQLRKVQDTVPFDVLNAEVRWGGMSPEQVERTITLLAGDFSRIWNNHAR